MASVNRVILVGRAGKDIEIKITPAGLQIGNFSLATSENIKKGDNWEEKTEWHNIVLFGKQAEYAQEKILKGNMIYLEGKIQTRSWTGDDDVKRYKTEIVGSVVKNLSPKQEGDKHQPKPQSEPKPQTQQQQSKPQYQGGGGGDDDLPFAPFQPVSLF